MPSRAAEMPGPTAAILPSLIRTSAGPSIPLAGSITCPPCNSTSFCRPSIIVNPYPQPLSRCARGRTGMEPQVETRC